MEEVVMCLPIWHPSQELVFLDRPLTSISFSFSSHPLEGEACFIILGCHNKIPKTGWLK